ncbi:aldose 1-epimerase family protein [Streptomyces sp. NBC_01216]|uniref:aldose 1-epimerase family protein n=1 Tax=unclassified Streptomyces TaxID=2593676 RepID=UPI002E1029D5|nr:aldose 1-epimerase family protein [Streptomyces sp. NBC_01216]
MQQSRTGRQLTLRHGAHTAVVVELGAALRSYTFGERAVLAGFAAHDRITGGHGQILAPWPNRVRDGRYRWEGRDQRLPLNEPAAGNAIHGLLRWVSWQVVEASEHQAVLEVPLWPQPGYPFRLRLRAVYTLGDDGLEVAVTAHNPDTRPAPYGFGQHPYLTAGTGFVDEAVLTVPARTWLPTDERGLPGAAAEPVDGTAYDLRTPRVVGALRLDTPFTGLDRGADGRAVIRLAHPSGTHGTDVWLGEGVDHVQLYTGDALPPEQRRTALAVEPMTCPPDAFNSRTGLVRLGPGERHVARWGLTPWG